MNFATVTLIFFSVALSSANGWGLGAVRKSILARDDGNSLDCVASSLDIDCNPIIASLLASDKERIREKAEKVEVNEGEVIIKQGDRDNSMYFITDGELECYTEKKPNKIIKTLFVGDYVGELALFLGTPRALSVRVKTKATLWRLTQDDFDSAVRDTDISDEQILRVLKRAYSGDDTWVELPQITFKDGTTIACWEKPHIHEGKFQPYNAAEALVDHLDKAAEHELDSGYSYKTVATTNTNRVVVVQDVNAAPATVLGHILDYGKYAKKVPQTLESEIYERKTNADGPGTETYFTRLKTGMRGFSMEFFVKAIHHPAHNSVVWTLDYDKLSEIDEACGYWRAEPHPQNPETKTRLYYSVDMSLGPKVALVVANFINKKAAKEAVGWVKKYSEQN